MDFETGVIAVIFLLIALAFIASIVRKARATRKRDI